MKNSELIDQLDKINTNRLDAASFKAVVRLHLYFTGRTHELMQSYADKARGLLMRAGGKSQTLDGVSGFGAQSELLRAWGDTWNEWQAEFQQARREAAKIAFGVFALRHDRMVVTPLSAPPTPQMAEGAQFGGKLSITESRVTDGIFDPQLRILLEVAEQYLYGDGLNLSGRIWQIDREARANINRVLMDGISSGKSAWDIAKNLETYLGANADCPRWTSTRLYGKTKSEIAAGDVNGLIRGDDCKGQGVSYNALRLARTEIQKIHSLATDRMMKQQPWVTAEKIQLSESHPEPDECDDAANGGVNNDGVYPVGTISLPLHPNCLCRKSAVMMDAKDFTSEINAWLKGGSSPMMDEYARDLDVDLSTPLRDAALSLAVWVFGNELKEFLQ